jgi:hypothetical protein
MAKASNILIESDGDAVHSGVEVPDLASLGWPPEDHVFIPVKSQLGVSSSDNRD